ncbi:MAG: NUDIX domain-containing protein [Ignavibacteriales bacterium]|nr:NUDIX domain-containing protein [Ignavibacteriales bacterium]
MQGPQYLLLRRSANELLYPGIWQIVTGSMKNSEAPTDAALRELEEETGIFPDRFWNVPHVNSFFVPKENAIDHSVFFAARFSEGSIVQISREHQDFRWLSFEEAKAMLVWPGQIRGVEVVHEYIVGQRQAASFLEIKLTKIRRKSS